MQANPLANIAPWALTAGAVLFAALIWFVGSTLSAVGSGWHRLQHRFRAGAPFAGEERSFQTGVMRWKSRYNHCLALGANQDGLSIRAMWLARLEHPPLFVPWDEVSVTDQSRAFRDGTLFTLGRKEQVPLWVHKGTGDWLVGFMPSSEERVEKYYSELGDAGPNS